MPNYGATSEKHYEEKFEFPLWKKIKEYADKHDISYVEASEVVMPEYVATIRYDDIEFEEAEMLKSHAELEVLEKEMKEDTYCRTK